MRRRRALIVALALVAVGIQLAQGGNGERQTASARAGTRVRPSTTPSPAALKTSFASPVASASPSPRPSPKPPPPSPTPSPKGPPFVLDAAPSCAGSTALIDLQIAATAARPVARLELFLDGAAAPLTPSPTPPLTTYAGRSSGSAAPGGSGQWMIRAIDKEGIADTRMYPYACA